MNSAFAKLERAKKHLAELRSSVDEFRAADLSNELSYEVAYPFGDADPRAVVTLRLELRAPSEWSLIMGDILTNLRAALDHAVYEHATSRQSLNSGQRKRLYHPMSITSSDWESTPEITQDDGTTKPARAGIRESLQELIAPDVLAVIEKHQPFNSEKGPPQWHSLAILSGLVNRDKHRAVLEVPINIAEFAINSASFEIVSEGDLKELPDGAVEKVITVRRAMAPADAVLRDTAGQMESTAAYLEQIEIPNTNERRACIGVMEEIVASTETYLDELKVAGC